MSAKHTPGPWAVDWNHGSIYVETLLGNDDSICEVHKRGSALERVANSRLIAAAPEGFEAAQEALIALEAAPDSKCVKRARQMLTSFISNVTGKQS